MFLAMITGGAGTGDKLKPCSPIYLSARQRPPLTILQSKGCKMSFSNVFSPLPGHTILIERRIDNLPILVVAGRTQEKVKAMINMGVMSPTFNGVAQVGVQG